MTYDFAPFRPIPCQQKSVTGKGFKKVKNGGWGATMDGFFIRHSCLHAATDVTTDGEDIRHQASTWWEWDEKNIKFIVNWNEFYVGNCTQQLTYI